MSYWPSRRRHCSPSQTVDSGALTFALNAYLGGTTDEPCKQTVRLRFLDKDFNPSPRVFFKDHRAAMMMGITAEYLARKYRIPRDAQDAFACRSHHTST